MLRDLGWLKKVKIIGRNKQVVPTSAFGLFKTAQEAVVNPIRWTSATVNDEFTSVITGSGSWSIVDTTTLQLDTGASSSSGISLTSDIIHSYIPGKGMFVQISIILGDSGVAGNIREWGLFDDDNGVFIRLNETQYEFVLRNNGVETVVSAPDWDIPVTPDANGHLWYFQYQWLGVGDFYLYYDGELVHTHNYVGTAQKVSMENPDLPIRIRNYNSTNTSNVLIKSGGIAVSTEGINLIFGVDTDKQIRNIKLTTDGRMLVSSPPPSAPPDTTTVSVIEFNNVTTQHDNIYVVPTGETLKITRFSAGAEVDSVAGNVIELYRDPNGTGIGMGIIDVIFTSGDSDQHDLDEDVTGDGTYAIRMRRRRFGGGSKEIFGRWEGYY